VGVANAKCSSLATIVCKNRVGAVDVSVVLQIYCGKKLANCTLYGFRVMGSKCLLLGGHKEELPKITVVHLADHFDLQKKNVQSNWDKRH
jgi:hypothetical protein